MRTVRPFLLIRLFTSVGLLLTSVARAGELPRKEPRSVGLDPLVLAKIDAKVAGLLRENAFPGALVGVARNGKVAYLKAFGDFKDDSLIRIHVERARSGRS